MKWLILIPIAIIIIALWAYLDLRKDRKDFDNKFKKKGD